MIRGVVYGGILLCGKAINYKAQITLQDGLQT